MVSGKSLDFRQLIGDLRTGGGHFESSPSSAGRRPFVTISRQPGAGGETLANALVERLNRLVYTPADEPSMQSALWQSFDRELADRVAHDHHVSRDLIQSLEYSGQSWLQELFTGISLSDSAGAGQMAVVSRLATTVRALAEAGDVVLVGHGSVFITHNIPGGIHVRVVAPMDARIKWTMEHRGLDERHARRDIEILDAQRDAFFRRYWPNQPLAPELFHLALNSGRMDEEQMVDSILPLVKPLVANAPTKR